jgi:serralysin
MYMFGEKVSGRARGEDFGAGAWRNAPAATSSASLAASALPNPPLHLALPDSGGLPSSGNPAAPGPQQNGNLSIAVSVSATGDDRIDGLLSGTKWSGPITYADTDSPSDYQVGYSSDSSGNGISAQNEGYSQLNGAQMKALHSALTTTLYTQDTAAVGFSVSAFTNLDVTYAGAGSANATIRAANSSDPGTAYAYYPANNVYGGDTFFGNAYDATIASLKTPVAGSYAWYTFLHEIGHSLGLKHSQEGNGPANVAVPFQYDCSEFTVMSYRSYAGAPIDYIHFDINSAPQSYMMLDIAALQTLYGADYTVNSGNTTYAWTPGSGTTTVDGQIAIAPGTNKIFATIWDGGGVDTYDLSAYTTDLSIDLNPGGSSLFSSVQQADLGDGHFARGNIFNALTFGGSNASLIENAIGGSGNDLLVGNVVDNVLTGGGGNDRLLGGAGNDILIGGAGIDTAYGNTGDDTFKIANGWAGGAGEAFFGGAGSDTLDTSGLTGLSATETNLADGTFYSPDEMASLDLSSIENFIGSDASDTVTGSGEVNTLSGKGGADFLYGLAANDTLDGGDGDDLLDGGDGSDTASYAAAGGSVTVSLLIAGAQATGGAGSDTLISIENLTGSAFADTLTGDANANIINGVAGADVMSGGAGNDTYFVDNTGDNVVEGAAGGTADSIYSSVTYALSGRFVETLTLTGSAAINAYGNSQANTLIGNSGANALVGLDGADILDGGAGADKMDGGNGDDTYYVDNVGDVVTESSPTGGTNDRLFSSVTYSLAGREIEAMTLTGAADINGTGNASAQTITGNSGANILSGLQGADQLFGLGGADTLDGGADSDTLDGGDGTDIASYASAASGVTVSLAIVGPQNTIGAGTDTLISIENLTGSTLGDTLTGDGGANVINGGGGDDIINGGTGADAMIGGDGNDYYYVDNAGDTVTEGSTGGANDTVETSVSFSLAGRFVETVLLSGTANIFAIGNSKANTLVGNTGNNSLVGDAGDDLLNGQGGTDTLVGGAGLDTFIFSTPLGATNIDKINDFSVVDDTIQLASTTFTGLVGGVLDAGAFYIGAAAHAAADRIIYDGGTGALLFDADGNGAGGAIQFATLSAGLALTNADFIIV